MQPENTLHSRAGRGSLLLLGLKQNILSRALAIRETQTLHGTEG